MKIIKRKVMLPGNREVNILLPEEVCPEITALEYLGDCYIFSNGTGYSAMTAIFALATSLEINELIYYPLNFKHMDAFIIEDVDENHYKGIVIQNYIVSQLDAKDISAALKIKTYKEEKLIRSDSYSDEFRERWETRRKLTVKTAGQLLILSSEKEVFTSMAQSCAVLAEYGDDNDIDLKKYTPHQHHDWKENTSKSKGITFYYWQNS